MICTMDNKKKVVAFLPIKLNSQRLPHKNVLPIADHPLCWHLPYALMQAKNIDEVFVFCSDEEVMKYVPEGTKLLLRDKYYDGDGVKSFELIEKFLETVDADVYVFANTTSPFIKTKTIEASLNKILSEDYDSALTVQEFKTFARYKGMPINYDVCDIPKTQDIEPVYVETSGFYMFEKDIFTKHHRRVGYKPYLQIVEGLEAVDIDTNEDYLLAKSLFEAYRIGRDQL